MTTPTLASLIASQTKDQIYAKLIAICQSLGLVTESWQPGDPTRSVLASISSRWADWETNDQGFPAMVAGGFLGLAKAGWLTILLAQNYNVQRRAATFATCSVTLTNTSSKNFGAFSPEDLTVENSHTASRPTFTNQDPFTLGPAGSSTATATFNVQAQIAGSAGFSDVGNIDTIVSPALPGVTITNTTAAVALDDESDDDATARGQAKLGSLSPAGPRDAYEYMILTPEMQSDGSNQTNVTRVRVIEESDYGDAIIFIAGAAGSLSSPDVAKAQATVEQWANPFVVNGQVINTTNLVLAITYELWLYDDISTDSATIQTNIATALAAAIALKKIGGDIIPPATSGFVYLDWIKAQIVEAVAPYAFKVSVTTPGADVPVAISYSNGTPGSSFAQVVVLGAVTCTAIHLVSR